MQTHSRNAQLARGVSAASIATFAALFSHVVGGGEIPGALGVLVPLVLAVTVSVLLAGRRLSLTRLSLSVLVSQGLFHALFVLGSPSPSISSPGAVGHHAHGAPQLLGVMTQEPALSLVQGDLVMWLSHLGAAVLTIAFLYRGELAIRQLSMLVQHISSLVRHSLDTTLTPRVLMAAPGRLDVQHRVDWTVLSRSCTSTLTRRGPPATH